MASPARGKQAGLPTFLDHPRPRAGTGRPETEIHLGSSRVRPLPTDFSSSGVFEDRFGRIPHQSYNPARAATKDLDGANGGGGRDGSWWFASHRPRTLSIFFDQPESIRGGQQRGSVISRVPAWAGIGLMNQQLRLNGALWPASSARVSTEQATEEVFASGLSAGLTKSSSTRRSRSLVYFKRSNR